MPRSRFIAHIFLLLAALGTLPALAEAPRVGLVLAGGGARGLAHIGVIKYLEEQGIKAHAVAGTSMGSVIGGLYASGLNAAEIEEVARDLDWRYAFDDSTAREQLSFRRKQEDFDFLIGARLRFKEGRLKLPMGAIEGQHLNFILHDLVAHVSRVRDFDKLPIPFRAVATDIVTGEDVVLAKGDLANAMRASMSIPGVFAPIDIDGQLLVDGGIAKNIPVDVVQAMGVDRLVVIDIGTPLSTREELDNVLALADQLTNIMTRKNSEQQLGLMRNGDILISPALDEAGVTTMSFEKVDEAIALGYAAAKAMSAEIATLTVPGAAHERQIARPKAVMPVIARVEVTTDSSVSPELLRNMITQPVGEALDKRRLENDIADIYGLDEFSRVYFDVRKEPEGHVLAVNAVENPAGSSFLKLGASWDQDSRGQSEFGLRASWRQKAINRLGGEWYTVGQLGGNSYFGTELYQPLDLNRRFYFDTNYQYDQRRLNISTDGELRARAVVDSHKLEAALGMNFGNAASLRGGVFTGSADTDIQIGSPLLTSNSEDDGGYFTQLVYDTLDRPYFPGQGARITSRLSEGDGDFGAESDYTAWDTQLVKSFTLGRDTLSATARWSQLDIDANDDAGTSVITLPAQVYQLGGFQSLSGYTRDSLAGNYRGYTSLIYYHRLTEQSLLPVDFPVYAGASVEAGNVWLRKGDAAFDDLIYAGSLFLGVDSPIGPIYLGVGVGENNQRALYLQLGQIYD